MGAGGPNPEVRGRAVRSCGRYAGWRLASGFRPQLPHCAARLRDESAALRGLRSARFVAYSVISLVGAAGFGAVSMCVETAAFRGYKLLESRGLIERLIPEKEHTVNAYQMATFKVRGTHRARTHALPLV